MHIILQDSKSIVEEVQSSKQVLQNEYDNLHENEAS